MIASVAQRRLREYRHALTSPMDSLTVTQELRAWERSLDPKRNSLNALRLFFALAVIVSHSWPISGHGDDPKIGDLSVGTWAVAGFFVISGSSDREQPLA